MALVYCGIRVTDLDRSVGFYHEGLGLAEVRRGRMSHGGLWVLLEDPATKQRLELNYYPPGNPYFVPFVVGEGLDHLGFKVDDARKWFDKLLAMGAEPAVEPWQEGPDEVVSYVKDPDGNWIEIYQSPGP